MKHTEANGDVARRDVTDRDAITVGAETYVLASTLESELSISRQTLWRWRAEARIPEGHRFRKQLVFTTEEADEVRRYANRIEPATTSKEKQLRLFRPAKKKEPA